MALQRIVLTINKKSAIDVKNILYKFTSTIPQINITKLINEEEVEIEFKVPFEISEPLLKKFIRLNLNIKPIDSHTKNILFQSANELKDSFSSPGFVLPDNPDVKVNSQKFKEMSEFVKKFLGNKVKITDDNRLLIKNSLTMYIDKLRKDAYFNKSKSYDNINELLRIAKDKKLKSSSLIDIAKNAGLTAIALSAERPQNVGELINICNNRNVHCSVNAKAAAKFGEIVFKDEKLYETDILIAVKKLNTRWLTTILDATEKDLTSDEITNFKKLKSFIEGKRK